MAAVRRVVRRVDCRVAMVSVSIKQNTKYQKRNKCGNVRNMRVRERTSYSVDIGLSQSQIANRSVVGKRLVAIHPAMVWQNTTDQSAVIRRGAM